MVRMGGPSVSDGRFSLGRLSGNRGKDDDSDWMVQARQLCRQAKLQAQQQKTLLGGLDASFILITRMRSRIGSGSSTPLEMALIGDVVEGPMPVIGGASEPAIEDTCSHTSTFERIPGNGARRLKIHIMEERIKRILQENDALCNQLQTTTRDLKQVQASRESLVLKRMAAQNQTERQKLMATSFVKNAMVTCRMKLKYLSDNAQNISELDEVLRRLQIVNRQLGFATDLQEQTIRDVEYRFVARSRQVRKLELAIYGIVSEAQRNSFIRSKVIGIISKAGPLVQGVLAKEAKRLAMADSYGADP